MASGEERLYSFSSIIELDRISDGFTDFMEEV